MAYKKPDTEASPKHLVMARVVQLYAGLDIIGSKMSLNSKESHIEVYDWGVRIRSKKTNRVVRIYASNIKGIEELPVESSKLD